MLILFEPLQIFSSRKSRISSAGVLFYCFGNFSLEGHFTFLKEFFFKNWVDAHFLLWRNYTRHPTPTSPLCKAKCFCPISCQFIKSPNNTPNLNLDREFNIFSSLIISRHRPKWGKAAAVSAGTGQKVRSRPIFRTLASETGIAFGTSGLQPEPVQAAWTRIRISEFKRPAPEPRFVVVRSGSPGRLWGLLGGAGCSGGPWPDGLY